MSMISMLGKVAMGIMVAKTVGKAMGGSGNIGDMLGGLLGGAKDDNDIKQGNKLPDLMNSFGGDRSDSGGLGDLLNSALTGEEIEATPTQEEEAKIILKAMISAAKADGEIDANEQKMITDHIGEVTKEEIDFVREQMQKPVDINEIVASTPNGMQEQVYLASLLTINLDNQKEAQYLDSLAKGLNISPQAINDIHQQVGAPKLYS